MFLNFINTNLVKNGFINGLASHAFMNEEAPAYPYNKEAADLAMQRTIEFFKRTLA
jgi:dienelactone hydrolase